MFVVKKRSDVMFSNAYKFKAIVAIIQIVMLMRYWYGYESNWLSILSPSIALGLLEGFFILGSFILYVVIDIVTRRKFGVSAKEVLRVREEVRRVYGQSGFQEPDDDASDVAKEILRKANAMRARKNEFERNERDSD